MHLNLFLSLFEPEYGNISEKVFLNRGGIEVVVKDRGCRPAWQHAFLRSPPPLPPPPPTPPPSCFFDCFFCGQLRDLHVFIKKKQVLGLNCSIKGKDVDNRIRQLFIV
jgi:hypothetical protein